MEFDGICYSFPHSGVYMGSSRKILPQKENRLSAENKMVGERGLEPPHIAVLDPKNSRLESCNILLFGFVMTRYDIPGSSGSGIEVSRFLTHHDLGAIFAETQCTQSLGGNRPDVLTPSL